MRARCGSELRALDDANSLIQRPGYPQHVLLSIQCIEKSIRYNVHVCHQTSYSADSDNHSFVIASYFLSEEVL